MFRSSILASIIQRNTTQCILALSVALHCRHALTQIHKHSTEIRSTPAPVHVSQRSDLFQGDYFAIRFVTDTCTTRVRIPFAARSLAAADYMRDS